MLIRALWLGLLSEACPFQWSASLALLRLVLPFSLLALVIGNTTVESIMNCLPSLRRLLIALPLLLVVSGCVSFRDYGDLQQPVYVDLDQITGRTWYVQSYFPTVADRDTYNATFEINRRRDGSLRIAYAYNQGEFDGPVRNREFRGTIKDVTTNADWALRVIWPFAADWRVIFVDPDYATFVIGHPTRKYLYILSETPQLEESHYQWLLDYVASQGYDTTYLRRVPHL